jgi:hypothetical protein
MKRSLIAVAVLALLSGAIWFFLRSEPRIDAGASAFPRLRDHEALARKVLSLAGSSADIRVYLDTYNPWLCGYASVPRRTITLTEHCAFPLRGKDGRYGWPSVQILAHEIGHIVHGHTSEAMEKDTPEWQQTEADEFSGGAMKQLGASLDEALSSLDAFDPRTHKKLPPDLKRRAVIERGWRRKPSSSCAVASEDSCGS